MRATLWINFEDIETRSVNSGALISGGCFKHLNLGDLVCSTVMSIDNRQSYRLLPICSLPAAMLVFPCLFFSVNAQNSPAGERASSQYFHY